MLGRCGATGDLVQRALLETFDVEHRPGVAAAVALGAADAGVTALAPAIERALSDLDELEGRYQTKRPLGGLSPAKVQRLRDMPIEKLLRAYLVRQIERGELSLDELLERADLL